MKRYFYAANDLDVLETLANRLQAAGLDYVQMHVLSRDGSGVESHSGLHGVSSLMQSDVLHAGLRGALLGTVLALLVLGVGWQLGAFASQASTTITLFLAIGGLGFCTWEAGFSGIQRRNRRFAHLQQLLDSGRHVFFVDVRATQLLALRQAVQSVPGIEALMASRGMPAWLIRGQSAIPRFLTQTMP
ncbi:MAG: magnesium transporter [Pseudomonadales bacterium]|nr:magnesium transporter [Pseudomonadales bacterium]MCP5183727.1 magnesium transporter [Pseudomonadales bacterium]